MRTGRHPQRAEEAAGMQIKSCGSVRSVFYKGTGDSFYVAVTKCHNQKQLKEEFIFATVPEGQMSEVAGRAWQQKQEAENHDPEAHGKQRKHTGSRAAKNSQILLPIIYFLQARLQLLPTHNLLDHHRHLQTQCLNI